MQQKQVHVVFRVLNFLFNLDPQDHKLLPIDKLILIALASHKGVRGIFPMQETLADELQTSLRYMKTRLKHLEKNGLIFVEKINRKNYYHLLFLSTAGDPQITSPENEGDLQITSQVIHRSPHRGSTDATINKVSNKLNKIERSRRKKRAPLSEDFDPSSQSVEKAKSSGLTEDEANYEFDKFMNYYLENEEEKSDWQLVLQNWFMRAGDYKRKNGAITVKAEEVRSTVPWYKPEDAPRRGGQAIGNLLNGLATEARKHMNGGETNGLGSSGQGTKKENR